MRGKKDATTSLFRESLQPLKSEAIHETDLSGKCSCVLFSSHNIYVCI